MKEIHFPLLTVLLLFFKVIMKMCQVSIHLKNSFNNSKMCYINIKDLIQQRSLVNGYDTILKQDVKSTEPLFEYTLFTCSKSHLNLLKNMRATTTTKIIMLESACRTRISSW